jgi:hypothetical protein
VIDQIDDAVRDFLIRELPVRNNEIEITFDQPKREWSARLSKPTVNIFLRDIRENTKLRSPQPSMQAAVNGNQANLVRPAVRVDLHYLITAWARDPLDEHRILARLLAVLFRFRAIPPDILANHVPYQESGVSLKLAQYENQQGTDDLWSVLDNELRPAIDVVATISVNPQMVQDVPLVREVEVVVQQQR